MVNWELAKRVIPNLYYAGEVIVHSAEAAISKHRQSQNDDRDTSKQASSSPSTQTSTEYLVHNRLEALFAWIQVIVLWHDPYNSLIAISGLFTSFLLLTYFAPNFYATIMIALFLYNLTKLWFRHIWPEIRVPPSEDKEIEARLDVDRWTYLHPDLMTLNEFSQIIKNLIKTSESFIGNRVSDLSLLFSLTTASILAPGIYLYALPQGVKELLGKFINNKNGIDVKESVDTISAEMKSGGSPLTQLSSDSDSDSNSNPAAPAYESVISAIENEKKLINLDVNDDDENKADQQKQQHSGQAARGASQEREEDDDGFVIL